MRPGKTWLYIAHGSDGRVLYVGIARRWGMRWQQHEARSGFFSLVARLDVQQFETREEAELAERQAIARYQPPYNLQLGLRPRPTRRAHSLADLVGPRDFCEVEFYCDNPACVAREVTVRVKWHQGDPTPRKPMLCPACYEPLKFHGILPPPEYSLEAVPRRPILKGAR